MRTLEILVFLTLIASGCSRSLYAVMENGKVGYISRAGKMVIPAIYDNCIFNTYDYGDPCWSEVFEEDYIPIKYNGKFGVIDTKGQILVPFIYGELGDNVNGTFNVSNAKDKYHLINLQNDTILKQQFSSPYFISSDRLFSADVNYQNVLYDPILDEIVDTINYKYASVNIKGLIGVSNDYQKFGLINTKQDLVFDTVYEEIKQPYDADIIFAQKDEMWGVLSLSGERIIDFQYDDLLDYVEDQFLVRKDSMILLFRKLEVVDTFYFDYVRFTYNDPDLFVVGSENSYKNKYGLFDRDEQLILDCAHDAISVSGNYVEVFDDGYATIYRIRKRKKVKLRSLYEPLEGELRFYGYWPFLIQENEGEFRWVNKRLKTIYSFFLE